MSVSIPSSPPLRGRRRAARASGIALCAILSVALCPASASAQVSDADKATARALAQQGQDALERRDFATAADRFKRAGELVHVPTLELGLARAEVGLGKWVAAHEVYNRMARETLPAGAPPVFTRALADAARELASLEPRIPTVTIVVEGAPSAKVTLDGAPVPSAVLGVGRMVDPGAHTVRAEADGFKPAQSAFTITEHSNQQVKLRLERVPGGVAAASPTPAGPAGAAPPPAPPDAASPPEPPSQAFSASTRKMLGFVGIGVGGAGLVMGAVTGGLAISKHASLAKACPGGACPASQASNIDGYHVVSAVSTAGFIAGGVLAAAGVVLVVTAPGSTGPASAGVAPVIGAGSIGARGWF